MAWKLQKRLPKNSHANCYSMWIMLMPSSFAVWVANQVILHKAMRMLDLYIVKINHTSDVATSINIWNLHLSSRGYLHDDPIFSPDIAPKHYHSKEEIETQSTGARPSGTNVCSVLFPHVSWAPSPPNISTRPNRPQIPSNLFHEYRFFSYHNFLSFAIFLCPTSHLRLESTTSFDASQLTVMYKGYMITESDTFHCTNSDGYCSVLADESSKRLKTLQILKMGLVKAIYIESQWSSRDGWDERRSHKWKNSRISVVEYFGWLISETGLSIYKNRPRWDGRIGWRLIVQCLAGTKLGEIEY